MQFYDTRTNVIANTLHNIIPLYIQEYREQRTIIVSDYPLDKRYYSKVGNVYGVALLKYNYGVNKCLSALYMLTGGFGSRTPYYFIREIEDASLLTSLFPCINKKLYDERISQMRKKYKTNTYWSMSYQYKYPCRGQRRRSNASTAWRLHGASAIVNAQEAHVVNRQRVIAANAQKLKQKQAKKNKPGKKKKK